MSVNRKPKKYDNRYTSFVTTKLILLKSSIQGKEPIEAFIKNVSEHVCKDNVIDYTENTYLEYHKGRRSDDRLAKKLLENGDENKFRKYINEKDIDVRKALCRTFSDHGDIDPDDLAEVCWHELRNILRSYVDDAVPETEGLYQDIQRPDVFFGREDDVRKVTDHIKNDPITYIQGESGIGKSTLINHIISNSPAGDKVFKITFPSYPDDPGHAFISCIADLDYRGTQKKGSDIYADFRERMLSLLSFDTLIFDNFDSEFSLPRMFSEINRALKPIDDGKYCIDALSKSVKLVFVSRQAYGSKSIVLKPLDTKYQWRLILNGTDPDTLSEGKRKAYSELIKWTEGNTYILDLLGKAISSLDNIYPVEVFYDRFIAGSQLSRYDTEVLSSKNGRMYDSKIIFDFLKDLYAADILSEDEISALRLMSMSGSSGFYRQYYIARDGSAEDAAALLWGGTDISDHCIERLKNLSLIRLSKDGVSQNQKVYVHSIVRTMVRDPAFSADDAAYHRFAEAILKNYRQVLPYPLLRSVASILSNRKSMLAECHPQSELQKEETKDILSALGVIYGRLGDFNRMIECEKSAVDLINRDDHRSLAAAYNQLSLSYGRKADSVNCIKYMELANKELASVDDGAPVDHTTLAFFLNNRIYAYGKAGRFEEQRRYAEEALKLIEEHPEDPFWQYERYEKIYSNLASGCANSDQPDYDAAVGAALKAIDSIRHNIEFLTALNKSAEGSDPSAIQKIETLYFRLIQENRHAAQFYISKGDPESLMQAERLFIEAEELIGRSDIKEYIDAEKLSLEHAEILLSRLNIDLLQSESHPDYIDRFKHIVSLMNNDKHCLIRSIPVYDGNAYILFRHTNKTGFVYCYDNNSLISFSEDIDRDEGAAANYIRQIGSCNEIVLFNDSGVASGDLSSLLNLNGKRLLGVFQHDR